MMEKRFHTNCGQPAFSAKCSLNSAKLIVRAFCAPTAQVDAERDNCMKRLLPRGSIKFKAMLSCGGSTSFKGAFCCFCYFQDPPICMWIATQMLQSPNPMSWDLINHCTDGYTCQALSLMLFLYYCSTDSMMLFTDFLLRNQYKLSSVGDILLELAKAIPNQFAIYTILLESNLTAASYGSDKSCPAIFPKFLRRMLHSVDHENWFAFESLSSCAVQKLIIIFCSGSFTEMAIERDEQSGGGRDPSTVAFSLLKRSPAEEVNPCCTCQFWKEGSIGEVTSLSCTYKRHLLTDGVFPVPQRYFERSLVATVWCHYRIVSHKKDLQVGFWLKI
ncbi:hypothetical protein D5086_022334 [Populus alba]|uniref:Uncharacterized protein n=1 Tax=Populus alba TaxID=43335 RepID=A0ACC4BF86_POPAL